MKRKIIFHVEAFTEFSEWGQIDKRMRKKIEDLVKDILRDPFNGIGKPEPLKGDKSGHWSRRINEEHRLVYLVKENAIEIISCQGHY